MRFLAILLLAIPSITLAGNTSSVFSPNVNPNDRSFEFRYANALGEGDDPDNWAYRIHYQQAFNNDYRWRVVGQYRDTGTDTRFDAGRLELLWQYQHAAKSNSNRDAGLRFDLVTRNNDRPDYLGINWPNQWQLTDKLKLNAILISRVQIGENKRAGLFMYSRYKATYKLDNGQSIALESFFNHGSTNDNPTFNERSQQVGVATSGKLGEFKYKLGYLRGVSSRAPDNTVSLWFSRKL